MILKLYLWRCILALQAYLYPSAIFSSHQFNFNLLSETSIMSNLPLDVLGTIFDILISENTVESRTALKSCALVSHGSVTQIQRYLFADISLEPRGYSDRRLAAILIRNPDLATYVKKLNITLIYSTLPGVPFLLGSNDLVSVINLASNLQSLDLTHTGNYAGDFADIRDPAMIALLARFRTVANLKFDKIRNLPMRTIASCTLLKGIEIVTPRDSSGHAVRVPMDSWELRISSVSMCRLEHLSVDHIACLPPFLDSQCSLRSLAVKNLGIEAVLPLLRASQNSLLRLSIETSMYYDSAPLDMDFPALRSISISQQTLNGGITDSFSWGALHSAVFFLACRSSKSPLALQEADIYLMLMEYSVLEFLPLQWGRLDTALAHVQYGSFEVLTIHVGLRGSAVEQKELVRVTILDDFPLLNRAHKVTVEVTTMEG
ncbi:hypothetical protein DXG01_005214 [Tephrocybe rancida]|nr:hypothetical protein DXG01_005214 [Tephrocybe rancida]